MKESNLKNIKSAVLDLQGASCASCAYTIEHLGRKVQGVREVHVDSGNQQVHVAYEGNPGSLERIVEIVKLLGYNASIRWESIAER